MTDKTPEQLQQELADALESVAKLTQASSNYKKERDDLAKKVKGALDAKEAAERDKLASDGNIDELKARLEADHKQKMDAINGELRTIKLDNALKAALISHNFNPDFMEAAEALMLRKGTYDDGVALIDGKPVEQAVKAFAGSKVGSRMVLAPDSTGSGSTGSSDGNAGSSETYNITQYSMDRKTDPAAADAKARRTGNAGFIPKPRA